MQSAERATFAWRFARQVTITAREMRYHSVKIIEYNQKSQQES